ncbi:L-serine ammonia-lyase, partial [uncultured Amnibacterium sp.]|uniref:L-serine ammonia-lyase n=1 Tax=uncultured Amnibacterium sp. TaxID=1631851 RepID=UPI0035CA20C2
MREVPMTDAARGVYRSALEQFRIGIGPSSSHTVGPMRAAHDFAARLLGVRGPIARVRIRLLGSLGATGIGHGTPDAVVAGLAGLEPTTCDPDAVRGRWRGLDGTPVRIGGHDVPLARADVELAPLTRLPRHPNALECRALAADGTVLAAETYYSIGGGVVEREGAADAGPAAITLPHPYRTAVQLLAMAAADGTDVAGIAFANERALRPEAEVLAGLDAIWTAMTACIDAGLTTEGELPGGLRVRRRAPGIAARLLADVDATREGVDWLDAVAMAVNEENAAGGRVVTAPTNGAAGIVPAVLAHAVARLRPDAGPEQRTLVRRFLLTAAAVGSLYSGNASISGAECGCQAEVGSASSMAAAGLCTVLGGTSAQVENAAEIAMEHNLGLTCDPVGGLVQVPCIERNAMGASK